MKKQIEVEVNDDGNVVLPGGVVMSLSNLMGEDSIYSDAFKRGQMLKQALDCAPNPGEPEPKQGCERCKKACSTGCDCGCHNKSLLGVEMEALKRGVGRKDYGVLAEAFRRNIELGMGLLEMRQHKSGETYPVFSESIRNEAEALIEENLLKLRSLTT